LVTSWQFPEPVDRGATIPVTGVSALKSANQSEGLEEKSATHHGAMARTIVYVPPLAVARARRDAPSTFVGSDGWGHRVECRRAVVRSTLCASAFAAGSYSVAFRIAKRLTLDAPSLREPPRFPPWSGPSRKNAGETRSAVLTPTVAKLVESRRDREEGKHECPPLIIFNTSATPTIQDSGSAFSSSEVP